MNYTVYCRLAWPKKCIISVKCVNSTTLGDTQRMLGLLGAAPGVVSYFRRKTARCVSRNDPKSDRCHLDNASPNLSGIGLRCVSCNRPLISKDGQFKFCSISVTELVVLWLITRCASRELLGLQAKCVRLGRSDMPL